VIEEGAPELEPLLGDGSWWGRRPGRLVVAGLAAPILAVASVGTAFF